MTFYQALVNGAKANTKPYIYYTGNIFYTELNSSPKKVAERTTTVRETLYSNNTYKASAKSYTTYWV